jgi:GTPase Era involved in 16S rRNA processing
MVPAMNVGQVSVPSDMVGMIIGKQGENIRRIQMDTNTKIQFAEGCHVHAIVYCDDGHLLVA